MKRRIVLSSLLLASLFGSLGSVRADGRWRELAPEERQQMRQQMRDHWQQEQELRSAEPAQRWHELSHEDRQRMRKEIREQRGWLPEQRGERSEHGGRGGRRD